VLVLRCRAVSRTRDAYPPADREDGSTPTDRRERAKRLLKESHSASLLAA